MKKRVCLLLVVLMTVFALPVNAKELEGFYANDNVNLNNAINTTSFVAGNSIDLSSKIDGLAFVAGNTINIGSDQDYLFVAGNMITVNNANAKDVFAAGSKITLSNSTIRDLYAAAAEVDIKSDVERNVFVGGDTVKIDGKIGGIVRVSTDNLIIGKDAVIEGRLIYPEDAEVDIAEGATIAKTETYKADVKTTEKTISELVIIGIIDFIRTVCSMLVVGLLLLLINKKLFFDIDSENKSFENIAKKFGLGFAFLCVAPIAAFLLLLTGIGAPVGIIGMLFYGILFYLSAIPTAYFIGRWVFDDKLGNDYLLLIVSIILLYVINKVPVVGGITIFLSLCIGLGIYVSLIYKYMTNKETKKISEKKTK